MRSERITLHLRDVRIVGTGMDGGHTYIHGKADYAPHGTVDAWAYFDFEDRAKEVDFEHRYRGGDLEVESTSWDFYPSTGLSCTTSTGKVLEMMASQTPNHSMERTADRCAFAFEMTSTPSPRAMRALVRRRSSPSRWPFTVLL